MAHEGTTSHANRSTFLDIGKVNSRRIRIVEPGGPSMDAVDRLSRPMLCGLSDNELGSRPLATRQPDPLPKSIGGEIRVKDGERFLKVRTL